MFNHTLNLFINNLNFSKNKYYFVDAGYSNQKYFLILYKNVQYYLKKFEVSNFKLSNTKELFNLKHFFFCNVVEYTIDVFKQHWKILGSLFEYFIEIQVLFIYVFVVIHNYFAKKCVFLRNLEPEIEHISKKDCPVTKKKPKFLGIDPRRNKIAEKMFTVYEQYQKFT